MASPLAPGIGKIDNYVNSYRRVNKRPGLENTKKISDVKSRVKALYDNGVPFFTKETFREIHQQLKSNLQPGHKISIRGVDGVIVEFDIEVGRVLESDELDLEYIAVKPGISYMSPLLLMENLRGNDLAYCSMLIHHSVVLRNKLTKEPIEIMPSIDTVRASFTKGLEQWESSNTCLEVQATLNRMEFPRDFKIDKIIAFACGRISQSSEDLLHPLADDFKRRVSYQHGLVLTLQKALSNLGPGGCCNIRCFAQDPAYTSVDSEILKEFGISTLDDPEGFLHIDNTTLVVSMMPNIPVKEIVADIARPAMIVWEIEFSGEIYCTDPTSPRVKDFLDNFYSETEFPHDKDNFKDVSIYTRLNT